MKKLTAYRKKTANPVQGLESQARQTTGCMSELLGCFPTTIITKGLTKPMNQKEVNKLRRR